MSSPSLADLERRAAAESRALVQHVAELKYRLEPQHVAQEATAQLTSGMRAATHRAATHMQTPYGVATTVTCLGFIAAVLVGRQHATRHRAASKPTGAAAPHADAGDPLRSILSVAVALGLGVGANRLAALADTDNDLLRDLSTEVKTAMERWTRDQVDHLARPGAGSGFGLLNLAAMALGLFSKPRDSTR